MAATVAGCFSMLPAGMLARAGHPPKRVGTHGEVELRTAGKPMLSKLHRTCSASVPGSGDAGFQTIATRARTRVSEALDPVEIVLEADLEA